MGAKEQAVQGLAATGSRGSAGIALQSLPNNAI